MLIEDRIARWRGEDRERESEGVIELICDAEAELRKLRRLWKNLPGQAASSKVPVTAKVTLTFPPGDETGEKVLTLMEHGFVNGYDVRLDSEGKKIRVVFDLDQVDAFGLPETDLLVARTPSDGS